MRYHYGKAATKDEQVIVYGTKVVSDRPFTLTLPTDGMFRHTLHLKHDTPKALKEALVNGVHVYVTHGRRVNFYSDRVIETPRKGQPFCYEVDRTLRFYWYHGDTTVYWELLEEGTQQRLEFWFIHQFLPLYLTWHERFVFFHTGGVVCEGKSLFFVAPSMGGKSTMTQTFLKYGHRLITDDTLPTFMEEQTPYYCPAVPYFRPYRAYETLGEKALNYSTSCGRVDMIYVLQSASAESRIAIDEVCGVEKFAILRKNGLIYSSSFMRIVHTAYLARFLNGVRVFTLRRPWDLARIDEVYEAVVRHAEGV